MCQHFVVNLFTIASLYDRRWPSQSTRPAIGLCKLHFHSTFNIEIEGADCMHCILRSSEYYPVDTIHFLCNDHLGQLIVRVRFVNQKLIESQLISRFIKFIPTFTLVVRQRKRHTWLSRRRIYGGDTVGRTLWLSKEWNSFAILSQILRLRSYYENCQSSLSQFAIMNALSQDVR